MTMMMKDGVFAAPSGLKVKGASYKTLEASAELLRPLLPLQSGEEFRLDCARVFEKTLPQSGYQYRTFEIGEVDECAAPNGSNSDSDRLVKPDNPSPCRKLRIRSRRPVKILCG